MFSKALDFISFKTLIYESILDFCILMVYSLTG